MGELWAFPIFLRYSLVEYLARTLLSIIQPSTPPVLPPVLRLPKDSVTAAAGLDMSREESGLNDSSIANIILSFRAISEQDWNDFFECVSQVEQVLRKDPAGIYPHMAFKTRDLYRKEIEQLSQNTGLEERTVAETVLDLAAAAPNGFAKTKSTLAETAAQNSGLHIGEFLLGKERPALEKNLGYAADAGTRFRRRFFRNAGPLYVSCTLFLSLLLFVLFAGAAQLPFIISIGGSPGADPWINLPLGINALLRWMVMIIVLPAAGVAALTVATSLVNWLITLAIKPDVLPKLEFKTEIPPAYQTLVVIPSLITSRRDIDSLAHQLELHYWRNPEPGLYFALLTDFQDADAEAQPEDHDLVRYAISAMRELNHKYVYAVNGRAAQDEPKPGPDGRPGLFYFLHRKRMWNPSEGKWIGWERKRGKLN